MAFVPSEQSYGAGAPIPPAPVARAAEERELRVAIVRTSGRINAERASIRATKTEIREAVREHRRDPAPAMRLHALETALHRDGHMLVVLTTHLRNLSTRRAPPPAAVKAAILAEAQATQGALAPKPAGYPPAPSAPPPPKTLDAAAAEATAEAADPAAADRHDAEVVDITEDHAVAVTEHAEGGVPIWKRPLFWGAAAAAAVAVWQREALMALINRGGA